MFNKNADKAMQLQMILGTMQGYQKESQSPKNAMNWAWGIVQQKQQLAHPTKDKKPGSMAAGLFGFAEKYIGKGITNVLDAPFSLAGHAVHAVTDVMTVGAGLVTGESLHDSLKRADKLNNSYDALLGHPADTITSGISDLVSKGVKSIKGGNPSGQSAMPNVQRVAVEVSVHPKHAQQFTAAVKAATGSYQTGRTTPNNQPTRTSF